MGDFMSPNRRDVIDRIRRRFETYRRHQGRCHSRADPYSQREWEQQRQETALLRQRWLESKTRRSSKTSKRSETSGGVATGGGGGSGQVPSGGPGGPPQTPVNQITKLRKLDPNDNSANCEQVYNFEESESQVPGGAGSAAPGATGSAGGNPQDNGAQGSTSQGTNSQVQSSVSVDINVHHSQTSQIKVTVNTRTDQNTSNSPHPSTINTSSTTSATIYTSSDICKQEPLEDPGRYQQNPVSNSSQNSYPESIGLDDVEEILNIIEKEEGGLPADLLKELDLDLRDPDNSLSPPDMIKDENNLCGPGSQVSRKDSLGEGKKKLSEGVMFADPVYDTTAGAAPQQGYPSAAAAPPVGLVYSRPASSTSNTGGAAPPLLGDTGPAAEALKQMAAHRQSQEQTNQYDMKTGQVMPPPYSPDGYSDAYARRMSTPTASYPSQYQNTNYVGNTGPYPYGPQTGSNLPGAMGPGKPDYGATKPLTHYPDPSGSGSVGTSNSLQQLQNQVQSHFSQAPQGGAHPGASPAPGAPGAAQSHIQITQNQHLHLSHSGVPHMQVSQTQQMHIQGQSAPQVSVAQQQTFHMSTVNQSSSGGNEGPAQPSSQHYPGMQQMYREKMQQQQQQQHSHRAQDHAMDAVDPMSYANRPPPEYKMPTGPHANYPNSTMRQNPLQTMQNMVNQTNQSMAGPSMYMKTEMESGAHCQQMTGPSRTASPMTAVPSSQTVSTSYMQQQAPHQQQQQPQQPQHPQVPNGTVASRPTKSPAPTYTSAIMRGQRPPNVNVGPEGLNISQRGEWTRMVGPSQMSMMGHGQPMVPGGPHMNHRPTHMPGPMVQYNRYPAQMSAGGAMQGAHMQMTQHHHHHHHQQQQQQQHHGLQRGPMPPHLAAQSRTPGAIHHMRMSQHQMAMAQAQQGGHTIAGMAMTQTVSMGTATNQHSHPTPPTHPQTHTYSQHPQDSGASRNGGTDFPALDFLDSGPGGNPDFFDAVSGSTDYNFIDDFLSTK